MSYLFCVCIKTPCPSHIRTSHMLTLGYLRVFPLLTHPVLRFLSIPFILILTSSVSSAASYDFEAV
jgi:hypothetical protein